MSSNSWPSEETEFCSYAYNASWLFCMKDAVSECQRLHKQSK